jgi:hypothetical protein
MDLTPDDRPDRRSQGDRHAVGGQDLHAVGFVVEVPNDRQADHGLGAGQDALQGAGTDQAFDAERQGAG